MLSCKDSLHHLPEAVNANGGPKGNRWGWGAERGCGMTPASASQMYGSQENGSINEDALASILKTALGVAGLAVTDLFQAIDQEEKGSITFGEWPQEQRRWTLTRAGGSQEGWGHTWSPCPPVLARPPVLRATQILRRKVLPVWKPGQDGGSFKSDFCRRVTQA